MIKKNQCNNFVAKHSRKYNRSAVHVDRKKRDKRGYRKHRISSI